MKDFCKPNNHDMLNKYRVYYNVTMMHNYLFKVVLFNFTLLHTTTSPFRVNTAFNVDFLESLEIKISVSYKDQILSTTHKHIVF